MTPEHDNFFTYSPEKFPNCEHGFLTDDKEGNRIFGLNGEKIGHAFLKPTDGACYGIVQRGEATLEFGDKIVNLVAGNWFTTAAGISLYLGRTAVVLLVQRNGYTGMDVIGRMESQGRLKYIDGARDSILFGPIRKGDPIINALFMPSGIHQTMHTHPSTRCGMILSGEAQAETRERVHPLLPGMIFFLPTNGWHKFRTDLSKNHLTLFAFHPDSEYGPSDEDHPMLTRTIVSGVSARDIPAIQTK